MTLLEKMMILLGLSPQPAPVPVRVQTRRNPWAKRG